MSETDLAFVSSEFDIFARKPVQLAIQETNLVHYKPIASVDHSNLEFLIPADYDRCIDPDIKLYQRQINKGRWKCPRRDRPHGRYK